ncbi:ankyrin repeat domain-containing protein [Pseudoalteromonas sp. BDTF-M6]|uniref:ankyrin repeat domain-containing protein n=1 Tax=Pseudoalteromonas sp. BDTF-M6 TaxID=2796132 RepID=UPI001BAEED56|nr:ankyrin repeat domain-containing protein [Pseudoalteromonas sp. BDTF-M6]MBS3797189.1 hypothetical protein [Pseudoalteromonas sp. BDTF-M6]
MKLYKAKRTTPYPTAQALLRSISTAFDTKSFLSSSDARKLDDSCSKQVDIHIGEFEKLKELTVISPIRNVYGDEIAARVTIFLQKVFKSYFDWISTHPLDGFSIGQANKYLEDSALLSSLVTSTFLEEDNHSQKLCAPNGVNLTILDDVEDNSLLTLFKSKEVKDRVRTWIKQAELPSFKYVASLEQHAPPNSHDEKQWNNLKWSIIATRFLLEFQPHLENARFAFDDFKNSTEDNRMQLSDNYLRLQSLINDVLHEYKQNARSPKSEKNKKIVSELLLSIKTELDNCTELEGLTYRYHQLLGKHLVLSGKLEEANFAYKKAFELSLYRAHSKDQIQAIISEALVVAAYQTKADKVFITRLKSASILFGFDLLPAKTKSENKQKLEVLASNEIEHYRYNFNNCFPAQYAYPNTAYPEYDLKVGSIVEETPQNPLDTQRKNMKVGSKAGVQRKMPPIVYAALHNDVEQVKSCLERGDSVNVTSEVGDSPLLMALSHLDRFDPLTESLDRQIFEAISLKPHSAKILNTVTTRKMNFPLMAAVCTGEPEIVHKVLSLNEDIEIDLRGGLDSESALYHALGLVKECKKPIWTIDDFLNRLQPENLHRLKPLFAGVNIDDLPVIKNERHKKILEEYLEEINKRKLKNYPTVSKMRQIARILIKKGSNVNLTHRIKGMDYTPLMLAAEMDELNLFKLMIEHEGDWKKSYTLPIYATHRNKAINCLDIAKHYRSERVVKYIQTELLC